MDFRARSDGCDSDTRLHVHEMVAGGPAPLSKAPSNMRLKLPALLLKEAICFLMFSTSAAA